MSVKQIHVDPANSKAYVFGTATGTFGVFSADGASYSSVNYDVALPAMTGIDTAVSNGQVFIVISGSTNALYRYDIVGGTAAFVASTSIATAGTPTLTLGSGETLYVSKTTSVFTYDFNLNTIDSTHTVSTTPNRSAYAMGQFYYLTSTGIFKRTSFSGSETQFASGGPITTNIKGLAVPANAGAVYFASTTAIAKMTPSGTVLWRKTLSNVGAFDLSTTTGLITMITASGTVQTYLPINSASTFAASASGSSADLSWATGVTDSDFAGVTIRRSQSGYPSSATDGTLVTSSAMVSSFSDSGLSDGTYYYTIFNQTTDGFYSSGTTSSVSIDATPPAAPVLTAGASGATVNLSWDSPASTVSFMLRRSMEGFPGISEGSIVTSTDASVTSLTESGVIDGTYYYSIFAADAVGNYSTAGTASVTVDTTAPEAPTLSAAVSGSAVSLSWNTPATAELFKLRRSTSGFPSSITDGSAVTTTGATSFVQNDLIENTYYYSIFAADAYGNYSIAGTSSARVDITSPSAPSMFAATASNSTVTLTWANPVDSDFASSTIRRSTVGFPTSPTDGDLVTRTAATSYVDASLPNATYYYSIFAADGSGNYSVHTTSSAVVAYTAPSTTASPSSGGGGFAAVAPSALTVTPLSFGVGKASQTGELQVTSSVITLNLNANPATVRGYAISLDPSFAGASILPLNTRPTVTLPNKTGTYTVYLKYYSLTGHASEVLSQTVSYSAGTNSGSTKLLSVPLKRVIQAGSKGNDVKALQQFLNANGFIVAPTGAGSPGNETTVFGPATTRALIKFQEANAAAILQPLGLKKGTGVLGSATIKLIGTL